MYWSTGDEDRDDDGDDDHDDHDDHGDDYDHGCGQYLEKYISLKGKTCLQDVAYHHLYPLCHYFATSNSYFSVPTTDLQNVATMKI